MQDVARSILPKERVSFCHRGVRSDPNSNGVSIYMHSGKASYQGLMTCGSVWLCPVCAAKISERRRHELVDAVSRHRAQGGDVLFLTLTFPHYKKQSLKHLLDQFSDARRRFMNRKSWKNFKMRSGLVGSIRALEVTHGVNGWHPHSHELLFVSGDLLANLSMSAPKNVESSSWTLEKLRVELLEYWQSAAVAAGLPKPNNHGLTIQSGLTAAEYATKWGLDQAKWGMDHELTKAHVKRGRAGSRSPFDILRGVLVDGDLTDEKLYKEFAGAFKGKRQLVWSKGLRDLLALDPEMSDEEIVALSDSGAERLGDLTRGEWKTILRHDQRAQVLHAAVVGGWLGVRFLIDNLNLTDGYRKIHDFRKRRRRDESK